MQVKTKQKYKYYARIYSGRKTDERIKKNRQICAKNKNKKIVFVDEADRKSNKEMI